jgi:hypothetical protein
MYVSINAGHLAFNRITGCTPRATARELRFRASAFAKNRP